MRVRFLQTAERSHMPAREVNNVRKHSDDLSREASGMERPSSARLPAPGSQLFFFFSMSQVATDQEAVVAVDSGATISCELPCLGLGQPLQRNPFFSPLAWLVDLRGSLCIDAGAAPLTGCNSQIRRLRVRESAASASANPPHSAAREPQELPPEVAAAGRGGVARMDRVDWGWIPGCVEWGRVSRPRSQEFGLPRGV